MKSNHSLMAAAMCAAAFVPIGAMKAQVSVPPEESNAPRVLMVVREQIKEGRTAAHIKSEEAWPRAYEKGNVATHYIGMTAESGASQAWYLVPYDSFGAMEKERAAVQHALGPELASAEAQDGELRTGSNVLLSVFRGDLSYHAAEAIGSLAKARFMGVTVLRVKYGHDADLAQAARLLIDADEKSGSPQPSLTYQVISGGPSGMYFIFSAMDSLARMDEAPARMAASRQAMGGRNQKQFDMLAPEIVQSSESLLFSLEPRMSFVSKEFAAGDPGFWKVENKAPVKAGVKGKKNTGQ